MAPSRAAPAPQLRSAEPQRWWAADQSGPCEGKPAGGALSRPGGGDRARLSSATGEEAAPQRCPRAAGAHPHRGVPRPKAGPPSLAFATPRAAPRRRGTASRARRRRQAPWQGSTATSGCPGRAHTRTRTRTRPPHTPARPALRQPCDVRTYLHDAVVGRRPDLSPRHMAQVRHGVRATPGAGAAGRRRRAVGGGWVGGWPSKSKMLLFGRVSPARPVGQRSTRLLATWQGP